MSATDPPEWRVALVGDSVLDDHYWLKNPVDDVRAQTERTLRQVNPNGEVHVDNFAVDASTVSCVLRGRTPAYHFRDGRRRAKMEPYPVDRDGVVRPLALLRKSKPTHVVSSIVPIPVWSSSVRCVCDRYRLVSGCCDSACGDHEWDIPCHSGFTGNDER